MSSAGLFIQDGTTTRAQFGSDVIMQGGTITLNGTTGTVGHDRVVIGSADIGIFTNNEKKVHINDAGMNIGPAANAGNAVAGNVRLGSDGVRVYGAATDDFVFVKSDGVDVFTAGTNVAAFGATTRVGDSANEHISMSSDGFFIKDGDTQLGKFVGDGVVIGDTAKTHISASTTSVNILTNGRVSASFGTTTTIGPISASHTFIDSGSLRLKDGSDIRLQIDANGLRIGNQFSVDSSGNATFGGTLTVTAPVPTGTVSGSAQLADAISGSSEEISASLAAQTAQQLVDSASVASAVQITSAGMNVLNSGGDKLAEYGANVFVGLQDAEHVKISSAGFEIKDDSTVLGKFVPDGIVIGDSSKTHISASTTSINILSNGAVSASFGTTTTIGSTDACLLYTSDAADE